MEESEMNGGEQQFTDVELVTALIRHRGNFHYAAKKLGVTRGAVGKRVKGNLELERVVKECREGRLDIAESSLDKAIREGEGWAVTLFLKTQGRERGYTEHGEMAVLAEYLKRIEEKMNGDQAGGNGDAPRTDSPPGGQGGGSVTGSAGI